MNNFKYVISIQIVSKNIKAAAARVNSAAEPVGLLVSSESSRFKNICIW